MIWYPHQLIVCGEGQLIELRQATVSHFGYHAHAPTLLLPEPMPLAGKNLAFLMDALGYVERAKDGSFAHEDLANVLADLMGAREPDTSLNVRKGIFATAQAIIHWAMQEGGMPADGTISFTKDEAA
jgi:hypothetical protein